MHSAGQSSLNVFISPPREGERKNCHSWLSGGIWVGLPGGGVQNRYGTIAEDMVKGIVLFQKLSLQGNETKKQFQVE